MNFIPRNAQMNLRLFDGGAAATGDGASAGSVANNGTASETNVSAVNTQTATGRGAQNTTTVSQDANATRQDIAVTAPDDERRTQFENYIRTDGKQFFDEKVQKIINQRFKETKTMESTIKATDPIIKTLFSQYGIKDGDYEALSNAITEDNHFYEERAKKNGVSVEVQKQWDKMQRENDVLKANQEQIERQQRQQQILENWNNQAQTLKQEFPEFDFDEMMNNKDFFDMVVRGASLEQAYFAVNARNMMTTTAQQTEKRVTDNIRARGMRPNENSVSSQATATSTFDVSKLTPSQRREYANRASKGETITFR